MESGTVDRASAGQPAALSAATLCEAFQTTAAERPGRGRAAHARRRCLGHLGASTRERVPRIAAGLASLGVERGDTVALMLTNRPEFNLADTAALHLGATAFSIYNTSTPEQVEYLFGNAGNRVAITERAFLPVVRAAQQRSPELEHIVLIDGDEDGTISLERSRRWARRASTSRPPGARSSPTTSRP